MVLNYRKRQSERLGLKESPLPGRSVQGSAEEMSLGLF